MLLSGAHLYFRCNFFALNISTLVGALQPKLMHIIAFFRYVVSPYKDYPELLGLLLRLLNGDLAWSTRGEVLKVLAFKKNLNFMILGRHNAVLGQNFSLNSLLLAGFRNTRSP